MAKIIVFGGHGKVALLLAPLLVARGDTVRAVIRNGDHADEVAATGATPVVTDLEHADTDELTDLLADADAVVFSAGAGGGNPPRTYAVDRDAAIRTMRAAEAAGVRRYVMVSYLGAGPDHGTPRDSSFFPYAEAKAAADTALRASDLDWTVVMPGRLTVDPPSGRIDPDAVRRPNSPGTSRGNVAQVVAEVLTAPGSIGCDLPFTDGERPIADAVRDLARS